MKDIDQKKIRDILKSKGIQPTIQRLEILYAAYKKNQHLTIGALDKIINRDYPKVSRASLFKNINFFVKVGLLKEIRISSKETIYDSNMQEHHHIHNLATNEFIDINIRPEDEKMIQRIVLKNIDRVECNSLKLKNLKVIIQAEKSST